MARKADLRKQRTGTVINVTSKKQESEIIQALFLVEQRLRKEYGEKLILKHESTWSLYSIVEELKQSYPEVDFHYHFRSSSIRPDGGLLCMMPLKPTGLACRNSGRDLFAGKIEDQAFVVTGRER